MLTPDVVRLTQRGVPGWLHTVTGHWFPLIAGGSPEGDDDAAKAAAKKAEDDAAAAKAAADAEAAKKAEDEAKLGDAGKAALDAERTARKAAEKTAKETQKRLDEIEAANLSESEKLEKRAQDGDEKLSKATAKIRAVNVRDALSAKGYEGAQAKAVARLLDGVEFDDDDEPKNLDDVLKAAVTEYGDLAKPAKPVAPDLDAGKGNGGGKSPALTADELQMAKSFGMTPEEYAANK